MADIVSSSDWMAEECENLSREGLRTLVIARRELPEKIYEVFVERYAKARASMSDR